MSTFWSEFLNAAANHPFPLPIDLLSPFDLQTNEECQYFAFIRCFVALCSLYDKREPLFDKARVRTSACTLH